MTTSSTPNTDRLPPGLKEEAIAAVTHLQLLLENIDKNPRNEELSRAIANVLFDTRLGYREAVVALGVTLVNLIKLKTD
jgi:hypothetical protein